MRESAKEGAAARDAAIEEVEQGNQEFVDAALSAIFTAAQYYRTFTTDDVWRIMHAEGTAGVREPRAMGAAMRNATLNGWVKRTTSFKESLRVACHRRPLRVWESLIFGKGATR